MLILAVIAALMTLAVVLVRPSTSAGATTGSDQSLLPESVLLPVHEPALVMSEGDGEPEILTPTTAPIEPMVLTSQAQPADGSRRWEKVSAPAFQRAVAQAELGSVEFITQHLAYGTASGGGQEIHVLFVHRSLTAGMRVSSADRGPSPVGAWAAEIGADAGVNANWYGPFDGPAVAQGTAYGGADHGYTALFGLTKAGLLVSQHHRVITDTIDPNLFEAVAGHPTLVHRGEVTTDFGGDRTFTERHPRTAIGATKSTDILIVVAVDGRRRGVDGMTGAETATLLEHLGAHDAVMLDGGGSTAMWIVGRGIVNGPADAGRHVGNQIAFFG